MYVPGAAANEDARVGGECVCVDVVRPAIDGPRPPARR